MPSKHNIIVRGLVLTSLASLLAGGTEADGTVSEMWIGLISMAGGRKMTDPGAVSEHCVISCWRCSFHAAGSTMALEFLQHLGVVSPTVHEKMKRELCDARSVG